MPGNAIPYVDLDSSTFKIQARGFNSIKRGISEVFEGSLLNLHAYRFDQKFLNGQPTVQCVVSHVNPEFSGIVCVSHSPTGEINRS